MKTNFFVTLCLVVLLAGVSVSARKAKKDKKPKCLPLADALAENTVLLDILKTAGLIETLTAEGSSFTIFAPSNEAFLAALAALNIGLEDLTAQPELVQAILLYHVLEGPLRAVRIIEMKKLTTALDIDASPCGVNTLKVKAKKSGVKIIGGITKAKVLDADIETCGPTIVHQIDSVLVPCPVSLGEEEMTGGVTSGSG